MKTKKRKINLFAIGIAIVAITAVCWDLATSGDASVEIGTYRLESAFVDAITTPTFPVKVAIVPSDHSSLKEPVARDMSLTYEQVEDMVRKAILWQGGLEEVILDKNNDGKIQVMLKPNIVEKNTPSGWGTNTDIRVIKALIKIISDFNKDAEIIVAEGSPRLGQDDPTSSTSCWESSGYRALLKDTLLEDINFSLFNLNQPYSDLQEVDLGSKGTAAPHNYKYMVHKKQLEVDVFITVPVLKIHDTGMTNALKNQIGTAPGSYYGYNKMKGSSYYGGLVHDVAQRRWTTEEIVDLAKISGIDFVVVDAIICLESYKTYNSSVDNRVRFNTIIAGWDPVAVDHVCTKLLCLNPDDIAHITLAERVGLGTNNPEFINIIGKSIIDIRKKVKKNTATDGEFGQSNRTWLLSKAFSGTDINNEYITNEASLVPEPGKENWSEATYFFDDRIDLTSYYNDQSNIISYAFSYFYSPIDKQAELWIGYDEDIKIYINGVEVFSYSGLKSYSGLVQNKENINIKKGENTLLVKIKQTQGTYEFALNICDLASAEQYAGNRVSGLKFYTASDYVAPVYNDSNYIDPPKDPGGNAIAIAQNNLFNISNYPNPVVGFTNIKYSLPASGNVTLNIYSINGKLIANLLNENQSAGNHTIRWDANNVKQGLYICKIEAGKSSQSIKLLVK